MGLAENTIPSFQPDLRVAINFLLLKNTFRPQAFHERDRSFGQQDPRTLAAVVSLHDQDSLVLSTSTFRGSSPSMIAAVENGVTLKRKNEIWRLETR